MPLNKTQTGFRQAFSQTKTAMGGYGETLSKGSMSQFNGQRPGVRTSGQATRPNKPLLQSGYATQNRRSMGEYAGLPKESQGLGRTRPLTRDPIGGMGGRRDFASSASSLPPMGQFSQSNYGATTHVGATSSIREQILAEV